MTAPGTLATLRVTRPGKPDARHELEFGGRVYRLTKHQADQAAAA
jgi:hypothetical protein